MPPLLLDLLYIPIALLYLPVLLYQMAVLKKNRRGWGERLGGVPRRAGHRPCIWIHAVSLGEVNATRRLAEEIESRLPGCAIALSTTTDTGYAAARRHYPEHIVFRYPLDFSFAVRRALDRIRPDAVVLMELEAWPNFVGLAARRGIPVGIANGRVTEARSMRRYRRPLIRGLARRMFSQLAWTAAQNETYAARFAELGARRESICVTGSMKYDTAVIGDCIPGDAELAEAMGIDRAAPLVVAGSTGPGEEAIVLEAYAALRARFPGLQLAIIPRKPERFEETARLIETRGYVCRRRSRCPDGAAEAIDPGARRGEAERGGTLFLGDTLGELRKFYALAEAVFVGRTLVPLGGSDLMEVAALGRPMCFGPHVENFAEAAEALLAAEAAMRVPEAGALADVLGRLLEDRDSARRMGALAREVVRRNTGATRKTVDLLCASLARGGAD